MRLPGPDHPITIAPAPGRVTVSAAGKVIVDSRHALVLREASYPPVYYFPREDAVMDLLDSSDRTTYCPYKGEASYYSIAALGEAGRDAIWSYETPYSAVADIVGCLAFYPDRVTIEAEQALT